MRKGSNATALAGTLLACALLLGMLVMPALAVHDNDPAGSALFELGDGATPTNAGSADILGSAGQPGPDWADVFNATGGIVALHGGITASFLLDDISPAGATDRTVFVQSNKNNDAVSSWNWDKGNNPPKDDLSNAYAWAGVDPTNGHVIVYAGLERLDPSGDSHVDIEFFQDEVGLDEGIPCDDPGNDVTPCRFVGDRTDGDILMSMDFTRGGGLGSVTLHIFNATTGVYDTLESLDVPLPNGTVLHEGCNGVTSENLTPDSLCAFNNGGPINGGPWPNYDNHGAVITTIERNGFTEFGIDITAANGGETPCISSIMGKTRSSQSFTAELKDFSGPLPFQVCGGEIDIGPSAVNAVGDPHTFTVYVNSSVAGIPQPAPDGTYVTVNLTAGQNATITLLSDTCASPGLVNGRCNVTFTSSTSGNVTGHANVTFTAGGLTQSFQTDGTGSSSGDAVKRFVDARIGITPPLDTNGVGELHVFTVNVTQDNGTGAGYLPATVGTVVVDLNATGGATPVVDGANSTCDDAGDNLDANGTCVLVITSPTAGTVVAHASVTLTVDGATLTRDTNGTAGNSGNATKIFVDGVLEWRKVDNAGRPLGNATFEVCRTHDYDTFTDALVDIDDVCGSVTDNVAPDLNATDGGFRLGNMTLGRYTIRETSPPPGYAADPDTEVVVLNTTSSSGAVATAFVNERPVVKLAGFGYVNEPNGTVVDGVTSGNTSYTIVLRNYGNATANLTVMLDLTGPVTFQGASSTNLTAPAVGSACPCSLVWSGLVLAPGADVKLGVVVSYADAPDGSVVVADLQAWYTTLTDTLARQASGSPASLSFTIQGD